MDCLKCSRLQRCQDRHHYDCVLRRIDARVHIANLEMEDINNGLKRKEDKLIKSHLKLNRLSAILFVAVVVFTFTNILS